MSRPSLDAVTSTVDSLLAGALDTAQMPAAIERLRQLFDGSKACLARLGPGLSAADAIATNSDEAMQRRCYEDLAEDFLLFAEGLRSVPIGGVYLDHALFGEAVLRSSRAWQEWMAPQDMYGGLGCRLAEIGPSQWFFDVQRGQRQSPFDAEEVALLQRLAPLLRRIALLSTEMSHVRLQRDEARDALDAVAMAIVLLDGELRVAYANAEADTLLADPEAPLGLRQGRLFVRNPADQRRLKQCVEAALCRSEEPLDPGPGSLLIRDGRDGRPTLSACIIPASPAASAGRLQRVMLALKPLEQTMDFVASSRQLFQLTESEARFASALACGQSLTQAAAAQKVRISTARTHLARIFQKTETRQQSQLVSLLRSAILPLRSHR
jgi:DNA-binding CsgD family transcriptional regulator/PAS domain-containing protein